MKKVLSLKEEIKSFKTEAFRNPKEDLEPRWKKKPNDILLWIYYEK